MLEHELYIAKHQVQYYANLAYEYQWVILDAMLPEEENEPKKEVDIQLEVYEQHLQEQDKGSTGA